MEERLQKYMARCGVASRRKSEELIINGKVKVNGEIIKELGIKVNPNKDKIEVDNNLIQLENKKVYILLNKPVGCVSTVKDEKGRETLLDIVKVKERIYPIGRLDYDTSGLILLTNDGDIYNKVIHPRQCINKVYRALIKGHPTQQEIDKFCNGIDIDGYITAKAEFNIIKKFKEATEVDLTIHEGKNRQIRKMCSAINHPVIQLKRISIGEIKLGNLEIGTWRELTKNELNYLNSL